MAEAPFKVGRLLPPVARHRTATNNAYHAAAPLAPVVDPGLLSLAFLAGAVALFAPCCIAMLPAYLAYAVRSPAQAGEATPTGPAPGPGRWIALAGLAPLTVGVGIYGYRALTGAAPGLGGAGVGPGADLLPISLLIGGLVIGATGLALWAGPRALGRALSLGGLATVGLLAVFVGVGLPVAALARFLAPYMAYLAVAVGAALVALGVGTLIGHGPRFSIPSRAPREPASPAGFVALGAAYGLASLGCTFPIFLSLVGVTLVTGTLAGGLTVLAMYALGSGVVLTGLTVLATAGADPVRRVARATGPWMDRTIGALVVVMGAYVVWYFWDLLPGITV